MTKAFVTGATGYVGREVVRLLVENGVETIAHVRPDSSSLESWRGRFSELGARVDATAWDEEAMAATLGREAPDLVFCLIGTTKARMKGAGEESYETVDYGLTALLVRAAGSIEGRPRFVYLSAMGVKAGSKLAYYQARYKAEQAVITSGLPYIIARPAMITGPDRDEARRAERMAGVVGDALLGVAAVFGGRAL
ncbi:MAG: SDR family oxidoreductase, partial [Bradymonadaceae bacterium]